MNQQQRERPHIEQYMYQKFKKTKANIRQNTFSLASLYVFHIWLSYSTK